MKKLKRLKNLGITLLILVSLIGSIFLYISFKKNSLENDVIEYLIEEKNLSKDDIIYRESFISNLSGDKNFMVSIKIKDDNKTYFYYKTDGEIILESYTENGTEYVQ